MLSAPLEPSFPYTRSLGPTLSRFMTGLKDRRIVGVRASDGRVVVPPPEYDAVTADALTDFVEVEPFGVVTTWSWMGEPLEGQPLTTPFAWAFVKLDGADTTILHAVDVSSPDEIRTGMRVQVRWAEETSGSIRDIECFEPVSDTPPAPAADTASEPIEVATIPVSLHFTHTASSEETKFLRALKEGRVVGQRCPVCEKVYVPPRGACPVDGVPTRDEVELPSTGTVTTYCIVNVPFLGQRIVPPYVSAYVLLDGADIAFQHIILEIDPAEIRMGLRVEAVWKDPSEWGYTLENIDHFRPSGEPDAPFESYAEHL